MSSRNVYVAVMTSLACPSIVSAAPEAPVTKQAEVRNFVVTNACANSVEALDIDDFAAQLEMDPAIKKQMAEARQWLGREFEGSNLSLRALRLRAGLSQGQLATAIGLRQPNVSAIEAGAREPSLSTIKKMASVLKVSADVIIAAYSKEEVNA